MRRLAVMLLVAMSTAALPGCGPKRPPILTGDAAAHGAGSARPPATGDEGATTRLDSGPETQPLDRSGLSGEDIPTGGADATLEGGPLEDIYFQFDQYTLSDEARATLSHHAEWLKARPTVKVTVEGHCDERGTTEYNLALGDKRARAARDQLVSLGVDTSRLQAISLGKERPKDPGHTEEAWAKNRRDHFAVSR
jgi:peptidoglycan-associated lipoprotein